MAAIITHLDPLSSSTPAQLLNPSAPQPRVFYREEIVLKAYFLTPHLMACTLNECHILKIDNANGLVRIMLHLDPLYSKDR